VYSVSLFWCKSTPSTPVAARFCSDFGAVVENVLIENLLLDLKKPVKLLV
jgi:hypothetical protein